MTLCIGFDRLVELGFGEVGPEDVGEVVFAVGRFPEEEVRRAQLTRGADDEIGIGHVRRIEIVAERLFGERLAEVKRKIAASTISARPP